MKKTRQLVVLLILVSSLQWNVVVTSSAQSEARKKSPNDGFMKRIVIKDVSIPETSSHSLDPNDSTSSSMGIGHHPAHPPNEKQEDQHKSGHKGGSVTSTSTSTKQQEIFAPDPFKPVLPQKQTIKPKTLAPSRVPTTVVKASPGAFTVLLHTKKESQTKSSQDKANNRGSTRYPSPSSWNDNNHNNNHHQNNKHNGNSPSASGDKNTYKMSYKKKYYFGDSGKVGKKAIKKKKTTKYSGSYDDSSSGKKKEKGKKGSNIDQKGKRGKKHIPNTKKPSPSPSIFPTTAPPTTSNFPTQFPTTPSPGQLPTSSSPTMASEGPSNSPSATVPSIGSDVPSLVPSSTPFTNSPSNSGPGLPTFRPTANPTALTDFPSSLPTIVQTTTSTPQAVLTSTLVSTTAANGNSPLCSDLSIQEPLECLPSSASCANSAESLQFAIDSVSSTSRGETIAICNGTTIITDTPITILDRSMTVCCQGVHCVLQSTGNDRNLVIKGSDVILSNLIFRDGVAPDPGQGGGNVHVSSSADVGIVNCVLENGRSSTSGGGGNLFVERVVGALTISNSFFLYGRDVSGSGGGGAWIQGTNNLDVKRSCFAGNTGTMGGALSFVGPSSQDVALSNTFVAISDSLFVKNSAQEGGALHLQLNFIEWVEFFLSGTSFWNNRAEVQGSMAVVKADVTDRSTFHVSGNAGGSNVIVGDGTIPTPSPPCSDLLFELSSSTNGISDLASKCVPVGEDVVL
ncbi:hypothetical protein ACA910_010465 [Epithemia clementina (nom. ined.)]